MTPIEAKPRLLFVDNQVDDFLKYRMGLALKAREAGYEVHVALPQQPGLEDIERQDIVVHIIYLRRLSIWPLDELRCWFSLLRLYLQLRPTLVHHMCLKPVLYGGIAARVTGVPAVVSTLYGLGYLFSTHTVKTYVLRRIAMVGLRFAFAYQAHRVIVQNSADRDWLLAKFNLPGDRVTLINGSGVDLSLFTATPEPDGPPVVLMVSRLLWTKGVGEFVAAARALRTRGIRARFVLVGEPDHGHPSAIPVGTIEHWCDAGDVEWLGLRHDIPALMAKSHIICLPSSYGEGVPRSLQEAAASGRPVVATDSPGCREVVRHGQNGLLVPVGDGEALEGAIARLIENAPLRAAMSTRGRDIAVTQFSQDQVNDATLTVYQFCSSKSIWHGNPSMIATNLEQVSKKGGETSMPSSKSMHQPRVLLIGNFLSESRGTRSVCEDLAVALVTAGWFVLTTSSRPKRFVRSVDFLLTVWLQRQRYNVAQVDVFSGLGFVVTELVCWGLRIAKKPYVLTLHGGSLPVFAQGSGGRVRRLFQSASAVTAPSAYLVEQMRSYRNDLVLLPNPLELARYPFKHRENPAPNLVWLRTFHDLYNPSLAVKVVALLANDFPAVRLVMIGPNKGDGSRESLMDLALRLGVQKRVNCPGPVPKEEISHWLQQGDIFLNTTRVDNTPVSVLEAMACGLCIISTNVGGIPYLLQDEHDALLVPTDDHQAMAKAVCRILTDNELARRLSINARRKAEQFEWSIILPRWERLLTSVAAQHSA